MTDLADVSLWENALEGSIPSTWAKLKKLKYFRIQDNQLTGQLPAFTGLQSFSFSDNKWVALSHNAKTCPVTALHPNTVHTDNHDFSSAAAAGPHLGG